MQQNQLKNVSVFKKIQKNSCRKKQEFESEIITQKVIYFILPYNTEKALKMKEEAIVSMYIPFQKMDGIYFARLSWEERRKNIGTA